MSTAMHSYPETFKAERERLGLSVRALSRLSGVSRRTIVRLESRQASATEHVLEKLEAALRHSNEFTMRCAVLGVEPGTLDELFYVIPWELDPVSRYIVSCFPDGMSVDEVARLTGLDPRTVANIERQALAKLEAAGVTLRDLVADCSDPDRPT